MSCCLLFRTGAVAGPSLHHSSLLEEARDVVVCRMGSYDNFGSRRVVAMIGLEGVDLVAVDDFLPAPRFDDAYGSPSIPLH